MPSYEHFSVKAWPSLMIGLGMELTYQRAGSGSGIGNGIVAPVESDRFSEIVSSISITAPSSLVFRLQRLVPAFDGAEL